MGTIGTLCSGSDVCIVVFKSVARYARQQFNLEMPVQQAFAAENNLDKQAFLMQYHVDNLKVLFNDAMCLALPRARNLVTNKVTLVRWSWIFLAGFTCVSCSKLYSGGSSD